MHIDFGSFGDGSLGVKEEDRILGFFACYVVAYPRDGSARNTKGYADTCLSAARADVQRRFGRRPGSPPKEAYGLQQVLKGLAKFAPGGVRGVRYPILQEHLHRVKGWLDLANNQVCVFSF